MMGSGGQEEVHRRLGFELQANSGTRLVTVAGAASRTIPVGSPVMGSFCVSPPLGDLVFLVIPASFKARLLAKAIERSERARGSGERLNPGRSRIGNVEEKRTPPGPPPGKPSD